MALTVPMIADSDRLDAAGRALFDLGRAFSRMPRRDVAGSGTGPEADLGAILLTQAVGDAQAGGEAVTVGTVATRLALDPSTASRLVARGVDRGLLDRRADSTDGRAINLSLTEAGARLAEDAARYQRSVFDAATAGWSPADRDTFARLFVAFAAAVTAMATTAQEAS